MTWDWDTVTFIKCAVGSALAMTLDRKNQSPLILVSTKMSFTGVLFGMSLQKKSVKRYTCNLCLVLLMDH